MADSAYGLWPLVIVNTLLFVAFGLSSFHPLTKGDWRAMGGLHRDLGGPVYRDSTPRREGLKRIGVTTTLC